MEHSLLKAPGSGMESLRRHCLPCPAGCPAGHVLGDVCVCHHWRSTQLLAPDIPVTCCFALIGAQGFIRRLAGIALCN